MFGDKLSMAHGLEVRVPYLDETVVEFAQRLGARLKIRGTREQVGAPAGLPAVPYRRRCSRERSADLR